MTGNGGHAAESVPLALFLGLRWREDAGKAIDAAVRCGGDTDTIASIAGQVSGAAGGRVPQEWRERIPVAVEIRRASRSLSNLMATAAG